MYIFILNFFKKSFLDLKRGIESRNKERVDNMKSNRGIYINKKFFIYILKVFDFLCVLCVCFVIVI